MSRLKTFSKLLMWEIVNPAILRSRRKRLYDWDEAFNGLNLACGLDVLPNWIGIDGGVYVLFKKLPSVVLRWVFPLLNMSEVYIYQEYSSKLNSINVLHYDLGYGVPFRSNTVPNIYSSHFLEHLTRQDAERLLGECFRVLRPGGGIRIAVPSLDQEVDRMRLAIAQYHRGQMEPVLKYLTRRPGFTNQYSAIAICIISKGSKCGSG